MAQRMHARIDAYRTRHPDLFYTAVAHKKRRENSEKKRANARASDPGYHAGKETGTHVDYASKQRLSPDSAVEHVIADTAGCVTRPAGHQRSLTSRPTPLDSTCVPVSAWPAATGSLPCCFGQL